ncbi:4-oxalocrotonate tautomerase family protein [Deferribacterales bacterium Es71-Z0220]|jgi:5-carboxymethyl-2-hydroxymuconate isomerase|uniref:tautomerase family protein n=1 Tax=Deferrivibrio essentukiensis TaxID=2880922 RepID=UPI001F6146E5|nr:4-oxalocrotonate tautomerase family protein [Deferrivibrio essentukiensis]MCB4205012.1 4-oxalocrotonate tautomerase family protein [Deferrivibrio essentukiensis]
MPHLQFEFNFKISKDEKESFSKKIMAIFSEVMDTGTGHIGITIREFEKGSLLMGRMKNIDEKVAFINADIREGRTFEQRRQLALKFMDEIYNTFSVPKENMYLVFTEHKGDDFNLYEKTLKNWKPEEDPLND